MVDSMDFTTQALKGHRFELAVYRILRAALEAVEPRQAVLNKVNRNSNHLSIEDRVYDLDDYQRVFIIGAGKASIPMAQGLAEILADRLVGGVIIPKVNKIGEEEVGGKVSIRTGGHPIPDTQSTNATQQLIQLVSTFQQGDLVFCVISGGGSALMTYPVEGVDLKDLQEVTRILLACGATIQEINTLRKHLDQIKGGGLLRMTEPAQLVTLILSDVVGNPLDTIASGPTAPDTTSFSDAMEILRRYKIQDQIPVNVLKALQLGFAGKIPDTLKSQDAHFSRVQNVMIGSNYQAAEAALRQASLEGFETMLLTTYLQGEAKHIGGTLAAIARQIQETGEPLRTPACIAMGGETTVTLTGHGRGGRNQEVALGAVEPFSFLFDAALITLATDGEDGPTDAAGAVVTGLSLNRAQKRGLNPKNYLSNNDAYAFFANLGDLIRIGPTGTNVNDLSFVYVFSDPST